MKKGLIAGVLVVALLLAGTSALAISGWHQSIGAPNEQMGEYHEQMETIMDSGSYNDLLSLREETKRELMPWVQNEEDFEAAKERHKMMEEKYGKGPHGFMGHGKGRANRMGGYRYHCPMES